MIICKSVRIDNLKNLTDQLGGYEEDYNDILYCWGFTLFCVSEMC